MLFKRYVFPKQFLSFIRLDIKTFLVANLKKYAIYSCTDKHLLSSISFFVSLVMSAIDHGDQQQSGQSQKGDAHSDGSLSGSSQSTEGHAAQSVQGLPAHI